jgi:hypothetical protein
MEEFISKLSLITKYAPSEAKRKQNSKYSSFEINYDSPCRDGKATILCNAQS